MAAETRQKGSKGNFIVSGDDLPKYTMNENLFYLIFPLIARKYGIQIQYAELKALHRLPGNRVLFSLHSRLTGQLSCSVQQGDLRNINVFQITG